LIEYADMGNLAKQAFKTELFEEFARIGKALSSGRRLELLELLAQGERAVEELAIETGMSIANTSQHLQVLRGAHLVDVRRQGTYAWYRLSGQNVLRLWMNLREVGEMQLAEIERVVESFFKDRKRLQATTCEDLLQQLETGSVVVLDVRPEQEYRAGHIRGARSIPVEELATRLKEISKKKSIVAYCRGPYCVFADDAVKALHEHGFRASRLTEGFPDWKLRGFPVETSLNV
jgi:rhodanese-related sulfurtransferase/DNA-binding transcriptional ArsR family regulator